MLTTAPPQLITLGSCLITKSLGEPQPESVKEKYASVIFYRGLKIEVWQVHQKNIGPAVPVIPNTISVLYD